MRKNIQLKKIFMKPGKNNKEDRLNFVRFWANYIKTHSDEEWSKMQAELIDSQLENAEQINLSREQVDLIKRRVKVE